MAVTPVSEWRKANEPTEVTLPSGMTAMLKKVSVIELAMLGQIPQTLMADFQGMSEKTLTLSPDKLAEFRPLLAGLTKLAFVEPAVGDEVTDTQLGVSEISITDQLAIFQWCSEGAQRLQPFRPQQG